MKPQKRVKEGTHDGKQAATFSTHPECHQPASN